MGDSNPSSNTDGEAQLPAPVERKMSIKERAALFNNSTTSPTPVPLSVDQPPPSPAGGDSSPIGTKLLGIKERMAQFNKPQNSGILAQSPFANAQSGRTFDGNLSPNNSGPSSPVPTSAVPVFDEPGGTPTTDAPKRLSIKERTALLNGAGMSSPAPSSSVATAMSMGLTKQNVGAAPSTPAATSGSTATSNAKEVVPTTPNNTPLPADDSSIETPKTMTLKERMALLNNATPASAARPSGAWAAGGASTPLTSTGTPAGASSSSTSDSTTESPKVMTLKERMALLNNADASTPTTPADSSSTSGSTDESPKVLTLKERMALLNKADASTPTGGSGENPPTRGSVGKLNTGGFNPFGTGRPSLPGSPMPFMMPGMGGMPPKAAKEDTVDESRELNHLSLTRPSVSKTRHRATVMKSNRMDQFADSAADEMMISGNEKVDGETDATTTSAAESKEMTMILDDDTTTSDAAVDTTTTTTTTEPTAATEVNEESCMELQSEKSTMMTADEASTKSMTATATEEDEGNTDTTDNAATTEAASIVQEANMQVEDGDT